MAGQTRRGGEEIHRPSPLFPGVGHFPHREDPDRAGTEIAACFASLGWN